jgi:hypothetical protein
MASISHKKVANIIQYEIWVHWFWVVLRFEYSFEDFDSYKKDETKFIEGFEEREGKTIYKLDEWEIKVETHINSEKKNPSFLTIYTIIIIIWIGHDNVGHHLILPLTVSIPNHPIKKFIIIKIISTWVVTKKLVSSVIILYRH